MILVGAIFCEKIDKTKSQPSTAILISFRVKNTNYIDKFTKNNQWMLAVSQNCIHHQKLKQSKSHNRQAKDVKIMKLGNRPR